MGHILTKLKKWLKELNETGSNKEDEEQAIVDVCLFKVVISNCRCELTHADIYQCVIKSYQFQKKVFRLFLDKIKLHIRVNIFNSFTRVFRRN